MTTTYKIAEEIANEIVKVHNEKYEALRGRDFEVDESLKEYYHFLWQDYDNWVNNHYNASEVLIIDMDTMDVVNNEADKHKLIEMVEEKLKKVRNKNDGE